MEADHILTEHEPGLDLRERGLTCAEGRVAAIEARLMAHSEAIVAHARRSVAESAEALARGVQVFVGGRIAAIEPDPETGQPVPVQGASVDRTERTDLPAALGPGWPAGLMTALEHRRTRTGQGVQGGTLRHGRSPQF